jgi:hypothetical protein
MNLKVWEEMLCAVMDKDADDDGVIDWSYDLWSANWAAMEAAAK